MAFINKLCQLAKEDERIFLLTGDLGFSVLEQFKEAFPKRFINAGVAEANMIGVAAGLSLSGKVVFVYSIIPFVTMRCYEQVRNDLCQQNLDVKIIGVGGGLSYGTAGPTHHAIEDIAIMRALPNMTVVCPGDPIETEFAVEQAVSYEGPIYIRLGKGNEPNVHETIPEFKIGKGIILKNGNDLNILATGNMLENAKIVADRLEKEGINASVISMHTIKPLDVDLIKDLAYSGEPMFTIEEHSIIGGLGSAVANILAESNSRVIFKRIALPDAYIKNVGDQEYLRYLNSLSIEKIMNKILKEINNQPDDKASRRGSIS